MSMLVTDDVSVAEADYCFTGYFHFLLWCIYSLKDSDIFPPELRMSRAGGRRNVEKQPFKGLKK